MKKISTALQVAHKASFAERNFQLFQVWLILHSACVFACLFLSDFVCLKSWWTNEVLLSEFKVKWVKFFLLSEGDGRETPWTSGQFIAGPHKDKQRQTAICFECASKPENSEKSQQKRREGTNDTQGGPRTGIKPTNLLGGSSANHCG